MGACLSQMNPLSAEHRGRLEKRLAELVKTWTIEYVKAYKTALLAKIREDSAPAKATYERQVVPQLKESESTKPHHHGYVYRTKGAGVLDTKFYKVYWALDAAYDLWEFKEAPAGGDIEAVLKDDESAKAAGGTKIPMYNYSTVSLSPVDLIAEIAAAKLLAAAGKKEEGAKEEKYSFEEYKLIVKVTHPRGSQQQMKAGFESEEDGMKWRGLLESAKWRAKMPLNPDPVLRAAFKMAFQTTRWKLWLWGNWSVDGTEGQLLGDLFFDVLNREILYDVLAPMKIEAAKKVARNMVHTMVEKAVEAGWKATLEAVGPAKKVVEDAVAKAVAPIFEAERELQAKINNAVIGVVNPKIDEASADLGKVFGYFCTPLQDAQLLLIKSYSDTIKEIITELSGESDATARSRAISNQKYNFSWLWWSKMRPISDQIYDRFYVQNRSADPFWALWDMTYDLIYAFRDLARDSLQCTLEQVNSSLPASADAATTARAFNDAAANLIPRITSDVNWIVEDATVRYIDRKCHATLDEVVSKLVTPLIEPFADAVPDVAKDLINPVRTAEECIDTIFLSAETQLVKSGLEKMQATVREQSATCVAAHQ